MKIFIILICSVLLANCTQQRLALRFADTAASWKADDYFDLSGDQKDLVKKQLRSLLRGLYENNDAEIPKLFDRADLVLAKAGEAGKVDCSEVERIQADMGSIFSGLAKLSAGYIKALTDTLSDEQRQHFVKEVGEKIEEDKREFKKLNNQDEERFERSTDLLKKFLGSLSDEQEKSIRSHLKANPFPFEEQLKNRILNYEKLKVASAAPESFNKLVVDYLQNWRSYQSDTYLQSADDLRSKNERFYRNLICESSPKQIKKLRKKLSSVKKDFEDFFVR